MPHDNDTNNKIQTMASVSPDLKLKDKKGEKNICAVKIQSKYQLIKNKQEGHVLNEMQCSMKFDHPFVLDLRGVAQDNRILYMFLDFMPHGDLMKVISKFTKLDRSKSQFYLAQIVTCIEYLHSKNMVFRDLKPENVLV